MKNEKGFTLVELIGVITLLALIALVVYPTITTVMKNTKEKAYNDQVEILIKAAKQWGLENSDELPEVGMYSLSIETLLNGGYISDDEVIDPRNAKQNLNGVIIIQNVSNTNSYEYRYVEATVKTEIAGWLKENVSEFKNEDKEGIFKGANPDNYIKFNDELWRIININDDGTVKIIRNDFLEERAWDTNDTGIWQYSTIRTYLNETYYNVIDQTQAMYLSEGTWCLETLDIDECLITYTDNVGLITAKEYIKASNDSECTSSNLSACKNSNYLNIGGKTYYTITRGSDETLNKIYRIESGVLMNDETAKTPHMIRPVVNLKKEVKITSGNGTQKNPYNIAI